MTVIGQFRIDDFGGFQPETSEPGLYQTQLKKAAKLERLLQDTRRDADILKRTNSSSVAGSIEVTDTIFAHSEAEVSKSTRLSYDTHSGELQSYSARIVGPGERIRLRYSANPLLLELKASSFRGEIPTVTKSLKLKQVGDNLFELSEEHDLTSN
jgi:hypothetical protein